MILEMLLKIGSIFLIVAIGYIASKFRMIPENSTGVLSKILFNVVTPSTIFITMQGQVFEGQLVQDTIWSFLSFTGMTLLIGGISFLIMKPFPVAQRDQGIYRIQLAFTNIGFMGIPLATAVFGDLAGLLILLMNIPFIVLLYSFGVVLMLYQKGGRVLNRELLRRMVNIPLVSSLLGVVMLAGGIQLPEILFSGFSMISDTMVPVGMLIVGIQLSKTSLAGIFTKENLWLCLWSLVLLPLLTIGVCVFLPQSDIVTATLVFAVAMPSGTLCTVLAEEFHQNTLLASETLALTTLLSLVTLPVWAAVLTHCYTLSV